MWIGILVLSMHLVDPPGFHTCKKVQKMHAEPGNKRSCQFQRTLLVLHNKRFSARTCLWPVMFIMMEEMNSAWSGVCSGWCHIPTAEVRVCVCFFRKQPAAVCHSVPVLRVEEWMLPGESLTGDTVRALIDRVSGVWYPSFTFQITPSSCCIRASLAHFSSTGQQQRSGWASFCRLGPAAG